MYNLPSFIGIMLLILAIPLSLAALLIAQPDPKFSPLPAPTPEELATLAKRFEQPYPSRAETLEVRDGATLNLQRYPAASDTTVLLLHGVLGSGALLNRTAGMLQEATGAEVVTLDLRGHGLRADRPGDVDYIGQYEDDVADAIAHLRRNRPDQRIILAGHSAGGGISLRYALKEARGAAPAVDGYLLFAPHLGSRSPTTPTTFSPEGARFVQLQLPRVLGLSLLNALGIRAANGVRVLFFNLPPELPLRAYSYRALSSLFPADHRPALKAVRAPLLVVVGSRDGSFKATEYGRVISAYSKGTVELVEGADHEGVLTDARTFEAIKRWWTPN
ncbi:MAG: alpha/beta hydrolase [Meiothermus sp.]|nr:alpha/beta hydrolase [Meiothermus sp.]